MGKYIKVFNNHNNYYNHIMSGEAASPNVSYYMNENEVHSQRLHLCQIGQQV